MNVVDRLAGAIDELRPSGRVLVALDGPDAAGKSTLARAIQRRMRRPTLMASVDAWHHPSEVRLRRGNESPEGYYQDSFDYAALTQRLLEPFRCGAATVTVGSFDYQADRSDHRAETAPPNAALLFDGVFLLRPELRTFWDMAIYVHVPESVTLARAVVRDRHLLGDDKDITRRYQRRYLPGQALYQAEASPSDIADIVIDNSRPDDPALLRWRVRW